jgi:hypothetical protein
MNTKHYFLIILIFNFFFNSQINAQMTFQKTYGGAGYDLGTYVQQTLDQGYIITGITDSYGAGNHDVYLVKTNILGDTLWTKSYGGTESDGGVCVQQTNDGGYIITGTTKSLGAGNTDIYLIKTNNAGDTLWTKTYGGTLEDYPGSVQQTSDGGYIIAGSTESFGSGNFDVYLIKTNSLGVALWTKTYGGSLWDYGSFVQQATDGGYIITGHTSSFGAGSYDFYLIKTNIGGDTLWTKTIGGVNDENSFCLKQTSDGGYIIVGMTGFFQTSIFDIYLVKTSATGDTLWTKTYGGNDYERGNSVQQTLDGGFIIAGQTRSSQTGDGDVYLIKTNNIGDTSWTKTYGVSDYENGISVQQTFDGGFIITGQTYGFGDANSDVYLIKTNSDGNSSPLGINTKEAKNVELKATPNPFNTYTTISIDNFKTEKLRLTVYNTLGQSVRQIDNILNGQIRIERNELKNGIYFFTVCNEISMVGNGKLIIE